MGAELEQVLMEVQSAKDELESGGTFLDTKLNTCLDELRSVKEEEEEEGEGGRNINSILDQVCGEIQSAKHELRAARVQLDEKIDHCFQQLEGVVAQNRLSATI